MANTMATSNSSPVYIPCPYVMYTLWCPAKDCEKCPNRKQKWYGSNLLINEVEA